MNKQITTVLALVLLIFGGVVFLSANNDDAEDSTQAESTQMEDASDEQSVSEVVVSEDGETVSYSGIAGEDALTTLRSGVEVETESSDFGEYVTAIDGVAADSSSQFWAFYVNGEQASVGADSYVAEEGDEIEWRLESF